jgi:hypothetical protein
MQNSAALADSAQTGRSLLPRLCTFERDGAPSIRKDQIHYLQRPETDGTPDVDQILLTQHFLTALLWHVAGNGLNSKQNAIISNSSTVFVVTGHAG